MNNVYVCDTSVIIDGRILDLIKKEKLTGKIYITNATIAELEHQANEHKEIGFAGFKTIKHLRELSAECDIEILVEGERPKKHHIEYAGKGGMDALIRDFAKQIGGTLITGDKVQHEAAEAEGIQTTYLRAVEEIKELLFENYFTPETMSIHLKENCKPLGKRGMPGRFELTELGKKLTITELRKMGEEIVEHTERNKEYSFEIEKEGASVIQMGLYRIVISKRPFSDGFEITVVKPITKLGLDDYEISSKLMQRLEEKAEGIVVCGPPGSGKSTFATALAEYYHSKKKIVKTMENPRDMRVIDEITQYTALEGSFENTKDVLLLVRPDYTFYDEMRQTRDFSVFVDMRLSGVGLVGVVHGSRAIDAIQRFIGKVDLGVIPQVIDTVILIDGGRIAKVYELEHLVKVPSGMTEKDLARPVVEVREFETGKVEFEMYKFGEETIVLPLKEKTHTRKTGIEGELSRLLRGEFHIEKRKGKYVLSVSSKDANYLFRNRKRLRRIENRYGPIEIEEF
ncbi:Flp pilus assembly complex ATPase component TadA [Candidatus Micrarchaeota archaeon]|nr:Flp pilus assembly complex ATPase component TadA [Candidatus Micrarchaeota archaeon]